MRIPSRSRGFTLLEVLISIFLIALALLGSAGLQAYSVKVTQGSQFRAQAVVLGMDLAERIEANNAAAVGGSYVTTLPSSASADDCIATACSPAQLAVYDLDQLQQNLARQLPQATASITRTGAGPFVYTIQITWQERAYRTKSSASADSSPTETFSFTVDRRIYDKSTVI
jgi:type IV pilus assembly protein PilV